MIRYRISYVITTRQGAASSWTDMTLPQPIRTRDDVDKLAEQIRVQRGAFAVDVMTWSPYED